MTRLLIAASFLAGVLAGCVVGAAGGGQAAPATQTEEVAAALDTAALRHGLSPRFLRCLAREESTYRPWVTSPAGYVGLLQFSWRTWAWAAPAAGWAGASPFDPWAAADVAAFLIARGGIGHWPPARRCGSPYWW